MAIASDVTSGAVRGLTPLIVLGGVIAALYLYRDQIKSWLGNEVVETVTALPGDAVDATQTIVEQQVASVTDLNPNTGGWLVSSVESVALWLGEKLGTATPIGATQPEPDVEVSPITGNPIVYQPSQVSEYIATNAYLPSTTLLPENQDTLWRPQNRVVGELMDISEFTGGVSFYDIIQADSSTGNTELYAVRKGAGMSEGGIGMTAWDKTFKKGTYTVTMF